MVAAALFQAAQSSPEAVRRNCLIAMPLPHCHNTIVLDVTFGSRIEQRRQPYPSSYARSRLVWYSGLRVGADLGAAVSALFAWAVLVSFAA